MGTITSGIGLVSGINTGQIIDQLMALESRPKTLLQTRIDSNNLKIEVTIDDPGAYTKPFTIGWDIRWVAGGEIEEYVCQENNRYLEHYANIQIEGVDPGLQSGKPQPKR